MKAVIFCDKNSQDEIDSLVDGAEGVKVFYLPSEMFEEYAKLVDKWAVGDEG